MSTRGALVFVAGGVEKITFNHFDSYPSGLGHNVAAFAAMMVKEDRVDEFREKAVKLKNPTGRPSQLHEEQQGKPELILNTGVHPLTDSTWMADSLFNEWSYVINWDLEVVEVYKGFQDEPHTKGRWASLPYDAPNHRKDKPREYWPVALIRSTSFYSAFLIEAITLPEETLPDIASFTDGTHDLSEAAGKMA